MERRSNLRRRAVLAAAGSLLGAGCLGAGRPGLRNGDGDEGYLGAEPTPPERDADWRMYGRDPGRTRHVPDADLPRDGVDIAWERSVGADNWLPPVVADGTVYCQYVNGLFVLDAETGDGTLSNTYGGFGRGAGPMAFGSTTLYRDGVLVAPYGDAVAGYAADPESWPETVSGLGERRARWWTDDERTATEPPNRLSSSPEWFVGPVVVDDAVVALHPRGTVSAVSPDDGGAHWRYVLEDANPSRSGDRSPAPVDHVVDTATETVVVKTEVAGSAVLVGLDLADGSLEWTAVGEGLDELEWLVVERDSLAAAGGAVYVADRTNRGRNRDRRRPLRLRELDAATGEYGWDQSLERESHVGLAVDGTTIYHVGTMRAEEGSDWIGVAAVDREDGRARWEATIDDTPGYVLGPGGPPPTVAGEHLLVPGEDGLHALERTSGERLWTFTETVETSGGGEMARAGITPAVVSDDRIVLGTTLMLYGLE
ncbi:outer membrane protein assembly factor BamB family protein [Halopiger thermotolerans]